MSTQKNTNKKIRMGMVGGGSGAFIGPVHRIAAGLDGQIELVCGAFSSNPENSKQTGMELSLDADRCYENFTQMMAAEAALDEDMRMQIVSIVTPNHLHFDVAKCAIEHGFHVISDKPATFDLAEALALKELLDTNNSLYALTHTYTGYPLVKEAKNLIETGVLGNVRKIIAEYHQGWLASKDDEGSKQAAWRVDPKQAGISCCMGDIGVHAANLAEYISGANITSLCSDLVSTVPGRTLDDDGTVLLRFDNGAHGVLMASQISIGEENGLKIRIYGDKAGLEWSQQEPNTLLLKHINQPTQMIRTGVGDFSPAATAAMRTPSGHPEGYLEAFANIYRNFAEQVRAFERGDECSNAAFDVPGINEAIRGMAFIENAVHASEQATKWCEFKLK